jgi:HAT1-interacting factor 1
MAAPSQPGSGTATPLVELDPEETKKSLNVSLADLCAKATALYAHKKYEEAAEVYGQAAEMQAEMNGEMNPENAEILFLYGRALFKVGQSKSDVLGGKAPEAKPAKPKASGSGKPTNGSTSAAASSSAASGQPEIKKPLFQFEGDENFEDSDEEEEDLARVLYEKKLEAAKAHGVEEEEEKGKGKESTESGSQSGGESAYIRHIKERLADTHDLLAEISLENERYVIAGS